jgi:hypothetical protein
VITCPTYFSAPNLLTNGSVLFFTESEAVVQLVPDQSGNYANGTFYQLASLPDGYAPLYMDTEVLPDGRLVVQGGLYNWVDSTGVTGAIYDPIANS